MPSGLTYYDEIAFLTSHKIATIDQIRSFFLVQRNKNLKFYDAINLF